MRAIKEQLRMVTNRLEELEKAPSELTKDAVLAELRRFYDSVKNVDVTQFSDSAVETLTEKPNVQEEAEELTPQPEPKEPVVEPTAEVVETVVQENVEEPLIEEPELPISEAVSEKKPLIGNKEKADTASDEKILAGQLSRKPLQDLRTGIPLNEKFGIIRGLFQGNASDYGDAVLKLNNAVSPTEMQHYLNLLQQRFGWDLESEAYATFSAYVERKMLTLETLDANTNQ